MNNERNEMLENNGHRTPPLAQGGAGGTRTSDTFPYGQMSGESQRDLRTTPRLDMNTTPRRKCNGEIRGEEQGSSSKHGWGLQGYPLAMAYSPYQNWHQLYTPEIALEKGTLFSELDMPFETANCRRGC